MGLEVRLILFRIPENDIVEALNRLAIGSRWNTTIDEALVIYIFVRQIDPRIVAEIVSEGWVDADPVAVVIIAMIVQVRVVRIEPKSRPIVQGVIGIELDVVFTVSIDARDIIDEILAEYTFLRDAIQDSASTASAEEKGVGTTQYFDLLHVVKRTIVLNVVTIAVYKEVSRRADAAKHDRIPMAFAL